jgi:ATP-dependent Clp protease ATP-binding subunit ClpA
MAYASERKHEFATLEHLLLALTDDKDAVFVLRACGVDLNKLREDLLTYLDHELEYLVSDSPADPRATESFNRALQRAVIAVQSSGREEVTGANVLIALFGERDSHAVYYLQEQNMTRFDAVNYIGRGVAKVPGLSVTRLADDISEGVKRSQDLDETVSRSGTLAAERQHDVVTLEHLLLALTEDPDAVAILQACQVDLAKLREDLLNYINKHLDYLANDQALDRQFAGHKATILSTTNLGSVLNLAANQAESTGNEEFTGADLLIALFSERESLAVYFFLREQNMTRSDAVTYVNAMRGHDDAP